MISKIKIQNFKSLEDITIECSNLNILTGLNGMGKSSIIQCLLLLRQSFDRGTLQSTGLSLNGDLVEIGNAKDALYEFAALEEIIFQLDFNNSSNCVWYFAYAKNDELQESKFSESEIIPFYKDLTNKVNGNETTYDKFPNNLDEFNIFKKNKFKYLHSNRMVNNEYPTGNTEINNRSIGKNGQFTAHFLIVNRAKPINDKLAYPGTNILDLDYQVSAWLNEISPNTKVYPEEIPGVNSVKLRYKFDSEKGLSSPYSPLNVGFGITYVLPVIVALLSSEPNDIIIIENPESHIHPQGQSAIGKLIALTANTGVQIFVETHSDHIINGVCVAVNKNLLKATNVKFNYINKNFRESVSKSFVINIDENGRLDDRELKQIGIGFFDQIQKDLSSILFNN